MKLNQAILTDLDNSVLCWLATVSPDGTPNVTPKEIFAAHGEERIVIADIASSNSVRNVAANPKVCVSFVDVFRQRGFKITGTATVVPQEAEEFEEIGSDLLRMAGEDFPIRNVISVAIERIGRIWAPSYALFPDRTEEERMRAAYETYGVRPRDEAASSSASAPPPPRRSRP